ncbi:hypothetical protein C8Q73DRAFT_392705 [Cubamyces lactineus]|nr:hypothetical protein C8Q73DRAFT_392705 [Cubamyces lactineus]
MAGSSSSAGVFRTFDNTDPGIEYSRGDWLDDRGISGVFNNTLAETSTEGATVHIEFTASQIVIIGATVSPAGASPDSGPISAYSIDGAKNSVFLFQADAANATGVTFFNSGPLTLGSHTLDIKIVSITDDIPYLLDAVYLEEPVQQATSTAQWVSTVFVTPPAATNLADQSNVSGSASSSSVPVGAIVGGTIGGVALLVSAALAVYFLYFRRRRHGVYAYQSFGGAPIFDSEKDHLTGHPAEAGQVEPFLAPAPTSSYSDHPPYVPSVPSEVPPTPRTPHTYPPASSTFGGSGSGAGSSSGRTLSVVNDTADLGYLTPAQRKAAEAKQQSLSQPGDVQFHADSGVRFDSQGRPIEASTSEVLPLADVPPEYTPS